MDGLQWKMRIEHGWFGDTPISGKPHIQIYTTIFQIHVFMWTKSCMSRGFGPTWVHKQHVSELGFSPHITRLGIQQRMDGESIWIYGLWAQLEPSFPKTYQISHRMSSVWRVPPTCLYPLAEKWKNKSNQWFGGVFCCPSVHPIHFFTPRSWHPFHPSPFTPTERSVAVFAMETSQAKLAAEGRDGTHFPGAAERSEELERPRGPGNAWASAVIGLWNKNGNMWKVFNISTCVYIYIYIIVYTWNYADDCRWSFYPCACRWHLARTRPVAIRLWSNLLTRQVARVSCHGICSRSCFPEALGMLPLAQPKSWALRLSCSWESYRWFSQLSHNKMPFLMGYFRLF